MNSCKIDDQLTLMAHKQLDQIASKLADAWKSTITNFEHNNESDFTFNPLEQSQMAVQEILSNEGKMRFGQLLQARGSELLHRHLEDETIQDKRRFSLIKDLLQTTKKFFNCDYNNSFAGKTRRHTEVCI